MEGRIGEGREEEAREVGMEGGWIVEGIKQKRSGSYE